MIRKGWIFPICVVADTRFPATRDRNGSFVERGARSVAMLSTIDYRKRKPLKIETVVQQIDEISTLPQVALLVLEIANDPESSAVHVKRAMESDAALSARVLRCVNSSAYAVRSKITNLQQAVAYLGVKQIRNLAVTAVVSDLFKIDETIGTYRRRDLWRHLVSVGICARLIAVRRHVSNPEDAFLAGLLHDIGIILEDQHAHDHFCDAILALDGSTPLAAIERRQVGFDHMALGERLGGIWGFPDAALDAIRYHHMSVNYRGEHHGIVRCVDVANLICTIKGIASVGQKLVKASKPALAGLKLSKEDLLALDGDLEKEIGLNDCLYQM
jgi:HD-like signal output (HDOD) protein